MSIRKGSLPQLFPEGPGLALVDRPALQLLFQEQSSSGLVLWSLQTAPPATNMHVDCWTSLTWSGYCGHTQPYFGTHGLTGRMKFTSYKCCCVSTEKSRSNTACMSILLKAAQWHYNGSWHQRRTHCVWRPFHSDPLAFMLTQSLPQLNEMHERRIDLLLHMWADAICMKHSYLFRWSP